MRGHVRARGKESWEIQVYLGTDPATGKPKRHYETVRGKKKDAEKRLREILTAIENGRFVERSRMTLGEYLESWLAGLEGRVEVTSRECYASLCRQHIIPKLGHVEIQKLTPIKIKNFYVEEQLNGKIGRRKSAGNSGEKPGNEQAQAQSGRLSPTTVRHIHMTLNNALNEAVELGLIPDNPCRRVKPPRREKKEVEAWTPSEAAKFLRAIADDRLYALFALALGTGMRRGEILALKWENVDLDNGTIEIKSQRVRTKTMGVIEKELKTEESRGVLPISRGLVEILMHHKELQDKEKALMGDTYCDRGYVFAQIDGKPLEPTNIGKDYFDRLQERAGVRRITFHSLRHTHATILNAQHASLKDVSERLRHTSVDTTGDIYSHLFDDLKREVADMFDRAMDEAGGIPHARGDNPATPSGMGDKTPHSTADSESAGKLAGNSDADSTS